MYSPLLIFCDRDPELQKIARTMKEIDQFVNGYYIDAVDVMHTASNPFFSMGGGRDAYLRETYNVLFDDELQESRNIVSIISVDENCYASSELIFWAYKKYLTYCRYYEKGKIGLIWLGCGTGCLPKEETMKMLQKAILAVFPERGEEKKSQ